MNTKQQSKKSRRGSILGVVVVIGLCLAIIGFGMLQMGLGSRLNSAISVSRISAREAADAGLRYALCSMNAAFPSGEAFPLTGSGTLNNSNASYTYDISRWQNSPMRGNYYSHYQIKSTGISDRGQRIIYAITDITNYSDYAVLVRDRIELKEDSDIDGYDSSLGEYGEELAPDVFNVLGSPDVKIGTIYAGHEYRIFLRNYVEVHGDVLVGPGGKVEEIIWDQATPGATTGPRYAMSQLPRILDVNIPSVWDADLGNIDASDFDPNYTIDGTGPVRNFLCNNITIPNGSDLVILGNVNLGITGTLDLNQGSELKVENDPPSSVKIYLYGNLNVGQNAWINNETRIPNNFWLWGTGTNPAGERWIINNSGWYYGVYYGFNAIIDVRQSAIFYGFILGRDFTLAQSGEVHYDVDLSRANWGDTGFAIYRWWEE